MEQISVESSSRAIAIRHLGRKTVWAMLLITVVAVLAMVLIPAWIIQPFRPQTPPGLELAYTLRRWSPVVTPIASMITLASVIWLWRRAKSWWGKSALVIVLIPVMAATWLARQNHFEWMFHPLPNAAYARVSETSFVGDRDMVMAVEMNGEAVAYPVRQMAYHHVVQDQVGGTPIVATY